MEYHRGCVFFHPRAVVRRVRATAAEHTQPALKRENTQLPEGMSHFTAPPPLTERKPKSSRHQNHHDREEALHVTPRPVIPIPTPRVSQSRRSVSPELTVVADDYDEGAALPEQQTRPLTPTQKSTQRPRTSPGRATTPVRQAQVRSPVDSAQEADEETFRPKITKQSVRLDQAAQSRRLAVLADATESHAHGEGLGLVTDDDGSVRVLSSPTADESTAPSILSQWKGAGPPPRWWVLHHMADVLAQRREEMSLRGMVTKQNDEEALITQHSTPQPTTTSRSVTSRSTSPGTTSNASAVTGATYRRLPPEVQQIIDRKDERNAQQAAERLLMQAKSPAHETDSAKSLLGAAFHSAPPGSSTGQEWF